MQVYGDARFTEPPGETIARVRRALHGASVVSGRDRHARRITALVELGILVQGLADASPAERCAGATRPIRHDARVGVLVDRLLRVGVELARGARVDGAARRALHALGRLALPRELVLREPEGYAFYALYPELYQAAARRFRAHVAPTASVVGVRSIGTSLACAVASGLERVDALFTVRPDGPPFERHLALAPERAKALLTTSAPVLVVDEGPGLSGSTFASVAEALESSGVDPRRIHFFTGHGGELGPYARPEHRARLRRTPCHHVPFEAVFVDPGAPLSLAAGFERALGPAITPLDDLSGGAWRARVFASEADWPAIDARLERRKLLYASERGAYLLKFAGLGAAADARARRAERLAGEGFVLRPEARHHGFLATRFRPELRPIALDAVDTSALAGRVADYLACLARQPEAGRRGAAPTALLAMARRNVGLALGAEAAEVLDRFEPALASIAREARPVAIDAKMQPWEWLVAPSGELLKADAFDHHAGHDLVGCQDVAWDVAGALVELARGGHEAAVFLEAFARRGLAGTPLGRRFYGVCYLAFQLGRATLGAESLEASLPAEARRLARDAERYASALRRRLDELARA